VTDSARAGEYAKRSTWLRNYQRWDHRALQPLELRLDCYQALCYSSDALAVNFRLREQMTHFGDTEQLNV
jgi:hypothetical protein